MLGNICERVQAAGMPLERVNVFISTLHPQYFGYVLCWENGDTHRMYGEHSALQTDSYQHSPMKTIMEGERVIRRKDFQCRENRIGLGSVEHHRLCELGHLGGANARQPGQTLFQMGRIVAATNRRRTVTNEPETAEV